MSMLFLRHSVFFNTLNQIFSMKKNRYAYLLNMRVFKGLLSLGKKGYLADTGWLRAYQSKEAVDSTGKFIPWLTYSFLDFLEGRLKPNMRICEYGSGNSTLFFASLVNEVISFENNDEWYHKVKHKLPSHAHLHLISLGTDEYRDAILKEEGLFDIILIDGRERIACLKNAVKKISDNGVIVFDDSEREKYQEMFTIMSDLNFKHLPFSGIAIGAIHKKCTSVFYRDNNVFGI